MKYLKQDEIDKYMMELDKYYRNILFTLPAQDEVDEMYSFLIYMYYMLGKILIRNGSILFLY